MSNGENATYVLGQSSWTSTGSGTTSTTLNNPTGVAIDVTHSFLYVADANNNRVMVYATPVSNGKAASYELGQPSGTAFTSNGSAQTQSGLYGPTNVAIDAANQKLYVADSNNNRVTVYNTAALANGANATFEIGQPSGTAFTSNTAAETQSGLNNSIYVTVDTTHNRLFVSDDLERRNSIRRSASFSGATS
jgi:DNA-binding beta-propeller fold protein YncE